MNTTLRQHYAPARRSLPAWLMKVWRWL